jgi:hypothetical protein
VLNAEDDCQRGRAGRCGKGKQPRRRRRCFGDGVDPLARIVWGKPAGLYFSDRLHRGSNAIHIDTGRIGRDVRDRRRPSTRAQLQLAPARQQVSSRAELVTKPPACRDDLIRCLAIDIKDPCECKDETGMLLTGNGLCSGQEYRTFSAGPKIGPALA